MSNAFDFDLAPGESRDIPLESIPLLPEALLPAPETPARNSYSLTDRSTLIFTNWTGQELIDFGPVFDLVDTRQTALILVGLSGPRELDIWEQTVGRLGLAYCEAWCWAKPPPAELVEERVLAAILHHKPEQIFAADELVTRAYGQLRSSEVADCVLYTLHTTGYAADPIALTLDASAYARQAGWLAQYHQPLEELSSAHLYTRQEAKS